MHVVASSCRDLVGTRCAKTNAKTGASGRDTDSATSEQARIGYISGVIPDSPTVV